MYSGKKAESVSAAVPIQIVLPRHTAKRLAILTGAPLKTAKHWLYYGPARHRARELAVILLAEMDRQDAEERARARQALAELAGGE